MTASLNESEGKRRVVSVAKEVAVRLCEGFKKSFTWCSRVRWNRVDCVKSFFLCLKCNLMLPTAALLKRD